jgi:hypothetical protein
MQNNKLNQDNIPLKENYFYDEENVRLGEKLVTLSSINPKWSNLCLNPGLRRLTGKPGGGRGGGRISVGYLLHGAS